MPEKKLKYQQKGFTLAETILSIFILMVGIVGTYNAIQNVSFLSNQTKMRLVATYLAQEGSEVVKNIRDNNFLNRSAERKWNTGLDIGTYQMKYDDTALSVLNLPSACSGDAFSRSCYEAVYGSESIAFLTIDKNSSIYSYGAEIKTPYKRYSVIQEGSTPGDSLKVDTVVLWKAKNDVVSMRISNVIYNWAR